MAKPRKSSLGPERKQDILNRLKSARGHLESIIKMVEEDTYCVQVIKQIAAVRGALDRVSRLELQNHLERCVVAQVQAGEAESAVAEIMDIIGLRQEVV
ncbi:MAG: metal-sensitive transcriptional regulator [Vulcanimicrobiaceae bacterium]|jgi:DNA-binding FrmR family transcriptional regulator